MENTMEREGGREGGRKGGKEVGREGWGEEGRERGRGEGREGGKEGGPEASVSQKAVRLTDCLDSVVDVISVQLDIMVWPRGRAGLERESERQCTK